MAITQRVTAFFTANAGQARAEMGMLSGSYLNVGRSARQTGRDTSLMNQQMRALGTTIKYMFAGAAVYGTLNMVRSLAQMNQQLGLISAIGGSAKFKELTTGSGLSKFQNQLFAASTDTVQNYNDMADAAVNFLSTVQKGKGVPESSIIPSLEAISKAATLSQTPVEDMTKALTTMNVAFGRPISTRNIEDFAAKWYALISQAPGGIAAAPQLVQQMGNLSAQARIANVTPGQMMALTLGTLRFGIPPSQAGQGLGYLLKSIATPEASGTVKSARELFASLGIDNEFIRRQGGLAALIRIFRNVRGRGVTGNLTRAGKIAMATAGDPNYDPNQISDLGIGGQGINTLSGIFRRQHALRTAIALYSMWNSGQLQTDLKTLSDSTNAFQKQQSDFANAWDRFQKQSGLTKAGIALKNMQLQMSKSMGGVLGFLTGWIPSLQKWMTRNPGTTDIISKATAGIIATLGVSALIPRGIKSKIPFIGRFMGRDSDLLWRAKVAEDFAKNTGGLRGMQDGSPERPFYVVLLKSFDPSGGGGGTGNLPRGKGFLDQLKKGEEEATKRWPWLYAGYKLASRFGGRFTRGLPPLFGTFAGETALKALKIGGPLAVAASLWDFFGDPGGHVSAAADSINTNTIKHISRRFPLASALGRSMRDPYRNQSNRLLASLLTDPKYYKTSYAEIERALEAQNRRAFGKLMDNEIKGDIWLNLEIKDKAGKKTTAKLHLDPSMFKFQGGKSPLSRGRPSQMPKQLPAW